MSEISKLDIILDELNSLEKQSVALVKKIKELNSENSSLKKRIKELESTLQVLKIENEDIKHSGSLNIKEKENLKVKINELVSKIDTHLRS